MKLFRNFFNLWIVLLFSHYKIQIFGNIPLWNKRYYNITIYHCALCRGNTRKFWPVQTSKMKYHIFLSEWVYCSPSLQKLFDMMPTYTAESLFYGLFYVSATKPSHPSTWIFKKTWCVYSSYIESIHTNFPPSIWFDFYFTANQTFKFLVFSISYHYKLHSQTSPPHPPTQKSISFIYQSIFMKIDNINNKSIRIPGKKKSISKYS